MGSHVEINTRSFIQKNYMPYDGDSSFLAERTERTRRMWDKISELIREEKEKGILDADTDLPSSITSHTPGYIDRENEVVVGLQTDKPLKRAIKPNGGVRLVEKALSAYGYQLSDSVKETWSKYRKGHNDGVFDAYTDEMKLYRHHHLLTGLPDSYGRGRIIGDYRRVALYGVDALIRERQQIFQGLITASSEETIRAREELSEQVQALKELKEMASAYDIDVSQPAQNAQEAVQWIYFAYLGAVKQQDGAAMSMGRLDAFLDIYFEKDLASGVLTEEQAQEIIDDFVIKLRIIRHLRPPAYDELFAGDPTWVTLVLGGTGVDGRNLVTKTSFRFLNTLTTLGPAPEPNLTVLWGEKLPAGWKEYCARQSVRYSSIQYENDDLMKPHYGDDYGIACCVSGMEIGKEMQFFGARVNLAKALLLAINSGLSEPVDESHPGGEEVIPNLAALRGREQLDFDEVWNQFQHVLQKIAEVYVGTMNTIHYMHDKYHYESLEMALHDIDVKRNMAFGIAGLSVVADSLSAIKHAEVRPHWNEHGVASGFEILGEYPAFGNDDDRVDDIAIDIVRTFTKALKKHEVYRDSHHTLSILTITSNVVYGKATGATPDGRSATEPFAPGANPMHGRDSNGAISSLNSVAKIPYEYAQDGISNTFSINNEALGVDEAQQAAHLVQLMDGYFIGHGAHHLNVNVFSRELLLDAQAHPEKYPQLTIRVSGYAVLFNRLSKEQQDEVISRTIHTQI